jgi:hypothetical protein
MVVICTFVIWGIVLEITMGGGTTKDIAFIVSIESGFLCNF